MENLIVEVGNEPKEPSTMKKDKQKQAVRPEIGEFQQFMKRGQFAKLFSPAVRGRRRLLCVSEPFAYRVAR